MWLLAPGHPFNGEEKPAFATNNNTKTNRIKWRHIRWREARRVELWERLKEAIMLVFGTAQLTHVHVAPGTNTHTQATLTLSHTNTHARKWGSFSAFLRCRLARQFQLGDRLWTRQKNESLEILWSVIITWRSLVKTNANTQHLHLHQNQIKKKDAPK